MVFDNRIAPVARFQRDASTRLLAQSMIATR
jgi:hypothetical protein